MPLFHVHGLVASTLAQLRVGGVVVVPGAVVVERPVVVVPGRACPYGFAWRYGRCRPI